MLDCCPVQTAPDVPGLGELLQRADSGLVGSLNVTGDVQACQGLQQATSNCYYLYALCCLPPVAPAHKVTAVTCRLASSSYVHTVSIYSTSPARLRRRRGCSYLLGGCPLPCQLLSEKGATASAGWSTLFTGTGRLNSWQP